jgi:hypothetical protein
MFSFTSTFGTTADSALYTGCIHYHRLDTKVVVFTCFPNTFCVSPRVSCIHNKNKPMDPAIPLPPLCGQKGTGDSATNEDGAKLFSEIESVRFNPKVFGFLLSGLGACTNILLSSANSFAHVAHTETQYGMPVLFERVVRQRIGVALWPRCVP